MTDFLKTVLLVNLTIAVTFGLFYEALELCIDLGLSPWFAAVAGIGFYTLFLWRECGSSVSLCLLAAGFVTIATQAYAEGDPIGAAVEATIGFVVEAMQDPNDGDTDD